MHGPRARPLPNSRIAVKRDSQVMHFQAVSGLDVDGDLIECLHGDSPQCHAVKRKPVTISLRDEASTATMVSTPLKGSAQKAGGTGLTEK